MINNINQQYQTFDEITFTIPLCELESYNKDCFSTESLPSGLLVKRKYYSKGDMNRRYKLDVIINYNSYIVRITVSAKCLGDRYPELICYKNFDQVISAINNTGIVRISETIDYNDIIVVTCDVTRDVNQRMDDYFGLKLDAALRKANAIIIPYGNNNLTIVTIRKNKSKEVQRGFANKSLTIYCKEYEMVTYQRKFLESLSNGEKVLMAFKGKTRYELKLKNKSEVKRAFGSNYLVDVLYSNISPIDDYMSSVLDMDVFNNYNIVPIYNYSSVVETGRNGLNFMKNLLLCRYFNYDLKAIKVFLKNFYSKNTDFHVAMKPYKIIVKERSKYEEMLTQLNPASLYNYSS
ncbi:hypothetical protein [Rudanella lutea]|uniref:hypothetical protein n=1 Tax=Rudanella lutea TaxID=451374 RepID=UPI00039F570B|nr:hypothetical protein [Rudanella lutea]